MEIDSIGRVIERLMTTLFGGMTIVLGWLLFKIGVVAPGSIDVERLGWRVKLLKIGPGVFFALFGAFILYTVMDHCLIDIDNGDYPTKPGTSPTIRIRLDGGSDYQNFVFAQSLNTVINRITEEKVNNNRVTEADLRKILEALGTLRVMRDSVVETRFGPKNLQTWRDNQDLIMRGETLPSGQQNILQEVTNWMTQERLVQ